MLPSEYTRLSHVTCRWQGGLRSHVKALHLKGGLPANPPPSWLVGVKRQQRRAHGERGQHPLRWFHHRELPRLGATVRLSVRGIPDGEQPRQSHGSDGTRDGIELAAVPRTGPPHPPWAHTPHRTHRCAPYRQTERGCSPRTAPPARPFRGLCSPSGHIASRSAASHMRWRASAWASARQATGGGACCRRGGRAAAWR